MILKFSEENKLQILLGLFIAAIVSANLLGTKITTIFGISASVGIFMFPITFLITDIIEEVYGKEKVKSFFYAGLFALALVIAFTMLSVYLPPAGRYEFNSEFFAVFSPSLRIMLGSLLGFALSQYHDIIAFSFWKKKTKGKFLWFRNNASTIVSQLMDTTIFMFIAFYMVTPQFTTDFIIALIIPYWILKVLASIIDTPFVYIGVRWMKNGQ